jgi:hypothetical protein
MVMEAASMLMKIAFKKLQLQIMQDPLSGLSCHPPPQIPPHPCSHHHFQSLAPTLIM